MPEIVVATPISNFGISKPYAFSDGISIRKLPNILWATAITKGFLSDNEWAYLSEPHFWLCASKDVENVDTDEVGDGLFNKGRYAALALQILCPSGGKHVFFKFKKTNDGYDNVESEHFKELCSTLPGRIASLEEQGLQEHFDAVYAGVKRAFAEKVVRLQNPVLLIEHGMQIGNPNLGALMFVMALDMLFMAGGADAFMTRVGGFFNTNELLFMPDSLHQQPNTVVRSVLQELYKFRNIIAHGQEIPEEPYLKEYELIGMKGERINHDPYYYNQFLNDSGLFILTASLRRIFVDSLFDEVKNKARWGAKMTAYEHRYKDSEGKTVTAKCGR